MALAVLVEHDAGGQHLELLLQGQTAGQVLLGLCLHQMLGGLQQGGQQALLYAAGTDDGGGDAVDAGVEEVQTQMDPV